MEYIWISIDKSISLLKSLYKEIRISFLCFSIFFFFINTYRIWIVLLLCFCYVKDKSIFFEMERYKKLKNFRGNPFLLLFHVQFSNINERWFIGWQKRFLWPRIVCWRYFVLYRSDTCIYLNAFVWLLLFYYYTIIIYNHMLVLVII